MSVGESVKADTAWDCTFAWHECSSWLGMINRGACTSRQSFSGKFLLWRVKTERHSKLKNGDYLYAPLQKCKEIIMLSCRRILVRRRIERNYFCQNQLLFTIGRSDTGCNLPRRQAFISRSRGNVHATPKQIQETHILWHLTWSPCWAT